MAPISSNDFRPGVTIKIDGEDPDDSHAWMRHGPPCICRRALLCLAAMICTVLRENITMLPCKTEARLKIKWLLENICAGNVYKIIEHLHVKPGKGSAFVRTKLKNLTSGGNLEKTFRCVLRSMCV
jgi:hypothetical protein